METKFTAASTEDAKRFGEVGTIEIMRTSEYGVRYVMFLSKYEDKADIQYHTTTRDGGKTWFNN